ncbi:S1C family serine protease [Natronospira bacteriovora]|uniref:Trypsin-like peptidase domain-containing protein n=1 Tax=Natronospira bacteriovora TaxID=3069753 RepID=A0ABU0W4U4_9GAMM|nr:trypsin-like peptidase domain-containing protein [Natronospira sp. AB-CW4]MDQ2069016.1 trypsin-like peptidase domain-containing protein [Natronospira sp. AB-CW4]
MILSGHLARCLLLLAVMLLGGCARLISVEPAPEFFDDIEPTFTVGVPEENPLAPIRTEGLGPEELRAVAIYRENHRAVVNVTSLSAYRFRFLGTVPQGGEGSGAIIDRRGVVVTNHHVVAGAQRLIVTLYDGSRYPAELVGSDPEMDLAVLRFDPLGRPLSRVRIGDSTQLQVGQRVLALGNPFGLDGTLADGVISALNRPVQLRSGFIIRDLIQSDAAINPGNSGGPLFNSQGEMVGINSMMISPAAGSVGISLSIPSRTVVRIVNHIINEGRVVRGWIDIEGIAMSERLAHLSGRPTVAGILITRTMPGGNAARAGIRDGEGGRVIRHGGHRIPVDGDILMAINDEAVGSVAELFAGLEATRPGDRVRLTLMRGNETIERELELSDRPRRE